jgi:hypothetical protein
MRLWEHSLRANSVEITVSAKALSEARVAVVFAHANPPLCLALMAVGGIEAFSPSGGNTLRTQK